MSDVRPGCAFNSNGVFTVFSYNLYMYYEDVNSTCILILRLKGEFLLEAQQQQQHNIMINIKEILLMNMIIHYIWITIISNNTWTNDNNCSTSWNYGDRKSYTRYNSARCYNYYSRRFWNNYTRRYIVFFCCCFFLYFKYVW